MADIQSIAARTKLVILNMASWNCSRKHKAESQKVNETHNTGDRAKVIIRLAEHEALDKIQAVHNAAYEAHKRITVPSVQEGTRVLPMGREFEHSQAMAEFRRQHEDWKARFLVDYDDIRKQAPFKLNGLFDGKHWPSREKVGNCFKFLVRYLPCPTDGAWGEWLEETGKAAEMDLRENLRDKLTRVAERCRADGKLYQSVFGNLKEIVDMVPDLNISGCAEIADVAAAAKPLTDILASGIRDLPAQRLAIAKQADDLVAALGGVEL